MLVAAAMSTNWANLIIGVAWLITASGGLWQARQLRRRARLGFNEALPAASDEVLTLARQGQRIKAIKRYGQLNPGVGLRDAKDSVDELRPRQQIGRSRP
jgi:Flp pilus assembly protein TadB